MSIFILLPVILPIMVGMAMLVFPIRNDRIRNTVNLIFILINSGLAVFAIITLNGETFRFAPMYMNFGLTMHIDGAGRMFGLLVAALWPFATLYSFGYMADEERKETFAAFYTIIDESENDESFNENRAITESPDLRFSVYMEL